jgi:UDP-N-acetylmuramate dehydrogenase
MDFLTDNVLAHYVTMRIGGPAKGIAVAYNEQDVVNVASYARKNNLKLITIGSGSNIIFTDKGFEGIVLVNKISELIVDEENGMVAAGSGVLTDNVVAKTVEAGLAGMEALSGIPGTIGAAPVNNIGAYGQEIKDTLVQVSAFDTVLDKFIDIPKEDCGFGYRDSIFKSIDHGRYIITKILFLLKPATVDYTAPDYPSLTAELTRRKLTKLTPSDIRKVILDLRKNRLPNTDKLPNTGSFFKNPMVSKTAFEKLYQLYPEMPHYPQPNGREKLAAAWLIEKAGLKDYRQDGFWIYDQQPLVIVNEKSTKYSDLQKMIDTVTTTVKEKFNVRLEPEPEII